MILAGLLKKETCRLTSANTVPILAPQHLLTDAGASQLGSSFSKPEPSRYIWSGCCILKYIWKIPEVGLSWPVYGNNQ